MGTKHADRRSPRGIRAVVGALAIATLGLLHLLPQATASATPASKVVVCHATASSTNPWVRVEVSENALPAHLGTVGSSHQHQHSLGRYDFLWTNAYDQDCVRIPAPEPITVSCSGMNSMPAPVQAVSDSGTITSVPCEAIHSLVQLPAGVHKIVCTRGIAGAPYFQRYQLVSGGQWYGVNCYSGDTVELGVQGGRFQVVCPANGEIATYGYDFNGELAPVPEPCAAGTVVPTSSNPVGPYSQAFDWQLGIADQPGYVQCPPSGSLALYFLGEGLPITTSSAMTTFSCTAGQPLDVTRTALTV